MQACPSAWYHRTTICPLRLELELELIQPHMALKPILRGEVGARALRVRSVSREEEWAPPEPHVDSLSVEIFEMELWDGAGSGGKETGMRRGLTSGKMGYEKLGSLRSGFWRYCAVVAIPTF